jgi:hypothetical protein
VDDPAAWARARPSAIWAPISRRRRAGKGRPSRASSSRAGCSLRTSSMTMKCRPEVSPTSWIVTMLGWLSEEAARASWTKRPRRASGPRRSARAGTSPPRPGAGRGRGRARPPPCPRRPGCRGARSGRNACRPRGAWRRDLAVQVTSPRLRPRARAGQADPSRRRVASVASIAPPTGPGGRRRRPGSQAYRASTASRCRSRMTRRFSFRVGVSSPFSTDSSRGSSAIFLTCS